MYIGPASANATVVELADDFDNMTDSSNFLSTRGGSVKTYCSSTGKAMVLDSTTTQDYELMTRDVKFTPDEIVVISPPLPSNASATPWTNTSGFVFQQVRVLE